MANRFAIYIGSRGCGGLAVGKVYATLPDRIAVANGYLRVIDESGDDYLYPATYFVFVDLPGKARRALTATRRGAARRTA